MWQKIEDFVDTNNHNFCILSMALSALLGTIALFSLDFSEFIAWGLCAYYEWERYEDLTGESK